MPAYQVLNDRTIYEPCLPDGSGHNDCIARAEDMKPCDCTCHLGVVVTTNKPHESEDTEGDEEYRKAAKAQYQDDGTLERDDNAVVSISDSPNPDCQARIRILEKEKMVMRCPQCRRQNLNGDCPAHHFGCTVTTPDPHFPGYVNPCGEVATSTTSGKPQCTRHASPPIG